MKASNNMTGNQEKFQSAMNQGHSTAWEQQWDQAAKFYQQAVDEFPENSSALTSLALALFELEKFDQSLAYYQKAANLLPEDPISWEKIARIQELLGNPQEAVKAFLKSADLNFKGKDIDKAIESWISILNLKPDHLMARTRLAMVYERQGRKAEAVNEYLATASIIQHGGEIQRALQVVEYCLRLQPDHPEAKNALAFLRTSQMLPKPSRPGGSTIDQTPAKKPEPPTSLEPSQKPIEEAHQKALVHLASLMFDQGDELPVESRSASFAIPSRPRGIAALSSSRDRDSKVQLYLGQAINAQTRGDNPQTLAELERAVNSGMDHPAIFFLMGLILSSKDQTKAIKYLQKSFIHPEYALASYLLLGQNYYSLTDYDQAATAYLQALGVVDGQTAPAGKSEEIHRLYETIIETQSQQTEPTKKKALCENIETHLNRADLPGYIAAIRKQMAVMDPDMTVPLSQVLLETGSSQVYEGISRVRSLAAKNKYYTAMEEAYYLLDRAPTYLPLHILIGEILLKQGKTQEAVNKFILAAELYNLRGEADQGLKMLEQVATMEPMNIKIRRQIVGMLIGQGNNHRAVEQLKKIAEIHYHLAELDHARQTYIEALRLVHQYKLERSLAIELLHSKADIDLQTLDLRQAARVYEQIRTIEPEDNKARIKLIDLYFRLGQDSAALGELDGFIAYLENSGKRQRVIEFLHKLIEEIPDKLEIRKRLANIYTISGKTAEAVEQLDFIADALVNIGNHEAALRVLKSIIALNPENVSAYRQAYEQLSQNKM